MTASRERKIKFIESFGRRALETVVSELLCIEGHWFLTDDQVEQAVSKIVSDARERQHRRLRNRPLERAAAGLSPYDYRGEVPALASALVRGADMGAQS
jgi:hypothetical protein